MQSFSIEALDLKQIRAAYAVLVKPVFPPDELKPLNRIEAAFDRGEYLCYGAQAGDEIVAAAFFVKIEREERTLMLFDYFAVLPALRCRGIGSQFLRALIEGPLCGMDAVLLEVDEPSRAPTPEERDLREHRLAFYLRNGLQDTGVLAAVYGVTYRILSLPVGKALAPDAVRRLYADLYRAILPPKLYRKWVFI